MLAKASLIMCLLIAVGCSGKTHSSDIFEAVNNNDVEYVRAWTGDINLSKNGECLLYIATGPKGGDDVVKMLLSKGANPNGTGTGYSPLMNAASWCSDKSVGLLIEAGANVNYRNASGKSALDVVGQGRNTDAVRKLLNGAK